jgi:subtilisin family serine protease
MNRTLAALLLGLGLLALAGRPAPGAVDPPRLKAGSAVYAALARGTTARVIVALRAPQAGVGEMTRRLAEVEATRENVLAGLPPSEFRVMQSWDTISAVAGDVTAAGLARLVADPEVLKIDVDVEIHAALAQSVPMIRADDVHNAGFTGRGVVVAVLDTGIDANHPDLSSSIVAEQCFCSGCCPNGSSEQSGAGAARDENGHGTNVSGIITGDGKVAPAGVAPDADIVAVRVLDKNGGGNSTQLVSGFDYVLKSRPEVKVVNLSLGSANLFSGTCDNAASFTAAFAQAINALKSRGTVVFASSLNNGSNSQIGVPACISSAVAVGAVYDTDAGTVSFGCTDASTRADQVPCFSNSSSKVDMLAPGAPITSTGVGGGASTFLGTSQASPHAAAAAALLLQANPGLSPDRIKAALQGTGPTVTDGKNGLAFHRIDVKAALDSVR